MWIRSQDKEKLINVNEVHIEKQKTQYTKDDINGVTVYRTPCFIVSNGEILGKYDTKEKALKVLDDITDWLNKKMEAYFEGGIHDIHHIYPRSRKREVYQMPTNDEVMRTIDEIHKIPVTKSKGMFDLANIKKVGDK